MPSSRPGQKPLGILPCPRSSPLFNILTITPQKHFSSVAFNTLHVKYTLRDHGAISNLAFGQLCFSAQLYRRSPSTVRLSRSSTLYTSSLSSSKYIFFAGKSLILMFLVPIILQLMLPGHIMEDSLAAPIVATWLTTPILHQRLPIHYHYRRRKFSTKCCCRHQYNRCITHHTSPTY